ncbi:MAG: DUF3048 domain-containing protein [Streptosporangiaceae bacterium]
MHVVGKRTYVLAVVAAMTLPAGLPGCTTGAPPRKAAPASSGTSSSASSPSTSSSAAHHPRSPFTGRRGHAHKPVLTVKIDNVAPARPPTGLSRADIVYIERVEGGLSRILAVFSSHVPKVVGPVRSARVSDLQLLRQFHHPAFAYSGAQGKLLPLIHRAPVRDLAEIRVPGPYFRSASRSVPHNLYLHPRKLLAKASHVSTAHDIGFRFGKAPPGGKRITGRTVHYPAFSVTFHWSKKRKKWLVSMDGKPAGTTEGGRLGAATVVIQHVEEHPSRFRDSLGNATPYIKTVGSGKALVLRGGRAYRARWSRPKPRAGTTFKTRSGEPMVFARGQVWVVYVPRR